MRKIQLLLVALFAAVGSAFAQVQVPADGDVGYLYNVVANKFISGDIVGADGKNHATTGVTGIKYTVIIDNGKWRFETGIAPAVDNEGACRLSRCQTNSEDRITTTECWGWSKWDVKTVEGKDGFFLYNQYGGTSSNFAKNNCITILEDGTLTIVPEADATGWEFVNEYMYEDYVELAVNENAAALIASVPDGDMDPAVKQALDDAVGAFGENANAETYNALAEAIAAANASIEANKEVSETKNALAALNDGEGPKAGDELLSILFPNAGFDASNNADGWNVTTNGGNAPSYKTENGNCGMTKYQGTIKMEKTIKGLPAGWYTLKAQAFGRKGDNAANIAKFEAGEDPETPGVIFANGVTKQVPNIVEGAVSTTGDVDPTKFTEITIDGETKYLLNNSNSGSYVFSLGEYQVDLIVYVADGELSFGFEKTTADNADYCGCDNFELIYEGDAMPQTFADGKYYLYNVEAGKFWGAGNDWGTRASLVDHAEFITLHYAATGYTIESQVSNGGTSYYFGGDYMDGGAKSLFIVPFGKYYKIYANDAVYGYDGTSTILGKNVEGDAAAWQIFTQEDMEAQLATATAKEPVDATWMLLDPNFGRNNRNSSAWQGSFGKGGDNTNMNAEKYMGTFDVFQELTVPNGLYAVQASAAVTYHDDRVIKDYDGEGAPVIYANEETADFFEMLEDDKLSNQGKMSAQFGAGVYKIEPIYVEVTDGVLLIGAKSERADIWAVWDNFEVKYYGPDASILEAKAAQAVEDFQKALAAAQAIDQNAIKVEAVKTAFAEALGTYTEENVLADGATKESIEAATEALAAATDAAEASIIAADILPKMKAFVETTNVYTQEAYDEYYTQYYDKYIAGTLTAIEARGLQDPNAVTGWHAGITVDNFLLSAWDTNPDFNNAPYYINSWSVEGDNDGTNFSVPFFEYWTGDANSLGEKTLTATMEGLETGQYEVSAWVRVRAKNETAAADATGITLQVNDAEEVTDVTEGETVDQFNLAEYTAKGDVLEDGTLKIKFIVAAENNISWLSFKNVKFEKISDATAISEVAKKTAQKAIFNAAGQQMKSLQKGINIVDGAKVYVK